MQMVEIAVLFVSVFHCLVFGPTGLIRGGDLIGTISYGTRGSEWRKACK